MKNLKLLFIISFLITTLNQTATAQEKIAHINVSELMAAMPDMKTANAALKKLREKYDQEYNKMMEEYKARMEKYSSEAATTANTINKARNAELTEMHITIEEYQQTTDKELQIEQEEVYRPMIDKARKAIQKVGRIKGYHYVMDSTPGTDVILAGDHDILSDVKEELGL